MPADDTLRARRARIQEGGAPKYHAKNAEKGKLFARERLALLLDAGSFVEDGTLRQRRSTPSCPPTA